MRRDLDVPYKGADALQALADLGAADLDRCIENALRVNPSIEVIPVSATRGDGLGRWYDRIRRLADRRTPATIRPN